MNISLRLCYEPKLAGMSGDAPYFRGGREQHLERGPLADLAVDGNRSVHPLDHVLDDR